MLLSNDSIIKALRCGAIQCEPSPDISNMGPVGLRLHLASELFLPIAGQTVSVDNVRSVRYERHYLSNATYCIRPGEFLLGSALERVKTNPQCIGLLDGRSTLARLGLMVYNSAALLDGCWSDWNRPVFEIANHGNMSIVLNMGMHIAMLSFIQLVDPITITMPKSI